MNFTLKLLPGTFAICRLDASAPIPEWVQGELVSITRTKDALSIVCDQEHVLPDVQAEWGWRCFQIVGQLDFSMVGIIASISTSLAQAGISVFVISTFDTDYFLVREADVIRAIEVLEEVGHSVQRP
jgi:hypothetical protein